jgi:hypothetical protein
LFPTDAAVDKPSGSAVCTAIVLLDLTSAIFYSPKFNVAPEGATKINY